MRVLLGQAWDPTHTHRSECADCGQDVYMGDRQYALEIRHEPDVAVRCQDCIEGVRGLRAVRAKPPPASYGRLDVGGLDGCSTPPGIAHGLADESFGVSDIC